MTEREMARNVINAADKEMAKLFEQRMEAVKIVAKYKKEHGLPIEDPAREAAIISKNSESVKSEDYRPYYVDFLKSTIEISKRLQRDLLSE